MLQRVTVGRWSLDSYRGIVPEDILEELHEHARALRGARILQVNATAYGGGVSELLRSAVPLLRDLGLDVDWEVISGSPGVLRRDQGAAQRAAGRERAAQRPPTGRPTWTARARTPPRSTTDYDFVIVHDPQPAALLSMHGKGDARWVWRCHIDTSEPNPETWAFLRPYLADFDAAVFTMPQFVPPDFPVAARRGDRAGDRPAEPEEPRARPRYRPPDPRLDRRRAPRAPGHAGLAL